MERYLENKVYFMLTNEEKALSGYVLQPIRSLAASPSPLNKGPGPMIPA